MRSSAKIAAITATLTAIGVALGSAISGGGSNRIDDFEQIIYMRNVDHGQRAFLGDCPLEREIIIERSGKTRISWYAQRPDHHGCVRAGDFDERKQWDEPTVARTDLTLSPSDLRRLIDHLERLSWKIEWRTPEYLGGTYSPGCERTTFSFPGRRLAIVKSGTKVASLSVYAEGAEQLGGADCIANDHANAKTLDAGALSFAPLLPDTYQLRPAVAKRLYRER